MRRHCLFLIWFFFASAAGWAAQEAGDKAQHLAKEVWKASGGENWSKIARVQFTFIVAEGEKELARVEHDWDVRAGTDRVKWKGRDVTVNLAAPAQDEDGKAAYARWVNDSYWLLAPLKVLDPGVKLTHEGQAEIDGVAHEVLRLSFEQVGLTPSDQYKLYLDPATKLVRSWDYIPKEGASMRASWENYETVGGLKLSTLHKFGNKAIRFADVKAW